MYGLLILLLFPVLAFAQGGLQVQCDQGGNQRACEQLTKQRTDRLDICLGGHAPTCRNVMNDEYYPQTMRARAKTKLQEIENPARSSPAPAPTSPAQGKQWSLGPPPAGTSVSDAWEYHFKPLLWTAFFIIVGIIALFYFGTKFFQNRVEARISEGMPVEGPMKVNLEIEQISSRKHRLHIDVKMTKRDWEAINTAGLSGHALFDKPGLNSLDNQYCIGHLLRVKRVDFDDLPEAVDAKDKLVSGLQALRTRIEQQKNFAARPAERKESLEI